MDAKDIFTLLIGAARGMSESSSGNRSNTFSAVEKTLTAIVQLLGKGRSLEQIQNDLYDMAHNKAGRVTDEDMARDDAAIDAAVADLPERDDPTRPE